MLMKGTESSKNKQKKSDNKLPVDEKPLRFKISRNYDRKIET